MRNNPSNESLSESELRYRSLRAVVADYYYRVEVEGGRVRRKFHGASCSTVTGYTAEDYAADPLLWMAIVFEEDRAILEKQIADVISDRNPAAIEYRIRRKDGKSRWMRKTVVPYHDNRGTLIAYDGILRDVTDRKDFSSERAGKFDDCL